MHFAAYIKSCSFKKTSKIISLEARFSLILLLNFRENREQIKIFLVTPSMTYVRI